MFDIGQFVMVDDLIAVDDGIVTPKGKHLGGCVGKIKMIDEKLRAAILDYLSTPQAPDFSRE